MSYINELAAVLGRCNVIVKLLADDLKMYAKMKTAIDADMSQYALDRLASWAAEWQLEISITKCFIMQIGKVPVDGFRIEGKRKKGKHIFSRKKRKRKIGKPC